MVLCHLGYVSLLLGGHTLHHIHCLSHHSGVHVGHHWVHGASSLSHRFELFVRHVVHHFTLLCEIHFGRVINLSFFIFKLIESVVHFSLLFLQSINCSYQLILLKLHTAKRLV
jgi:hypothetical protein